MEPMAQIPPNGFSDRSGSAFSRVFRRRFRAEGYGRLVACRSGRDAGAATLLAESAVAA